jgi:hypothetical protein
MAASIERAKRGTGSMRERLPGVWEIRVVVGFDPVHSRSVQRSLTVHGDKPARVGRRLRHLPHRLCVGGFASDRGGTPGAVLRRYGVATHLVDQGKLLKAQARLGHSDPSTTLRHYSHAISLDDEDIADELDAVLNNGKWTT